MNKNIIAWTLIIMFGVGSTVSFATDNSKSITKDNLKGKVSLEQKKDEMKDKLKAKQEKAAQIKKNMEDRKAKIEIMKANNIKMVELKKQIAQKTAALVKELKGYKESKKTLTLAEKKKLVAKVEVIKESRMIIKQENGKLKGLTDEYKSKVNKAEETEKLKGIDKIIDTQNIRIENLKVILQKLN